jgi:hypothetical protein
MGVDGGPVEAFIGSRRGGIRPSPRMDAGFLARAFDARGRSTGKRGGWVNEALPALGGWRPTPLAVRPRRCAPCGLLLRARRLLAAMDSPAPGRCILSRVRRVVRGAPASSPLARYGDAAGSLLPEPAPPVVNLTV